MALSNSQYSKIMRDYEEKQNSARLLHDSRLSEVLRRVPEYKALDNEAIDASMEYARMTLLDSTGDSDRTLEALRDKVTRIADRKKQVLLKNGYPADYLEPVYSCPDCKDTGYIGTQKCHCFKQAIVDLLYSQSNIKEVLKKENFSTFRSDLYSRTDIDPVSNCSSYDLMNINLTRAKEFVAGFPASKENLFFSGTAGLGKTFLSHCIADELLKKGYTVLYLSAPELFDIMRKDYIPKKEGEGESSELGDYIMTCDLLIIDDLGSEHATEFTVSCLNICINERILAGHSTIISSNLMPYEINETYGERNFSRIAGLYTLYRFYGKDLRFVQKLTAV
ncbi:MAG: ATP-binding protein [Lachnospiraceae bacterium]|nr:ATP-binding protein [Lachnospiraceae bacterium]